MDQKNEGHLDLRQRKTRALLVKALAELMEERPFSELSVVDICSRAMVHRTTFYAHFNDKRELLSYLLSQLEQECVETCLPKEEMTSPKDYFLTAAKNTLEFFQNRRSLYLACLNSGMEAEVHVLSDRAAQELCLQLSRPAFRDAVHRYTILHRKDSGKTAPYRTVPLPLPDHRYPVLFPRCG